MAIYIQFEKSPHLVTLITEFRNVFNPAFSFTRFLQDYMDLDTAVNQGLDFWGEKLGLNRNFEFLITNDKTKFGFKGADLGNFSFSNFAKISRTATFLMPDEMYRKYLKLILMRIVTQPTGAGLVTFMNYFYEEAIVTEGNLKVTIDFTKYIEMPNWEQRFLSNKDVVPIPAGITYIPLFYSPPFGENENEEGILNKEYYEVEEAREKAKTWVEAILNLLMSELGPIMPILQSQGAQEFESINFMMMRPLEKLQKDVYSDWPGDTVDQTRTKLTQILRTFQKEYPPVFLLFQEKFKSYPEAVETFTRVHAEVLKIII